MIYQKLSSIYRDLVPAGSLGRRFVDSIVLRVIWIRKFLEIQKTKSRIDAELEKVIVPFSLPSHLAPKVSIIIPVFNNFIYTYTCLKSISERTEGESYEVILVDNASIDETKQIGNIIKNIVLVRNDENLGFVKACNLGAARAKGDFLVFLNNDTKVTAGWLTNLRKIFESNANAGLVGSKLIYPDGTLQEAGGIVWNDPEHTAWNYGRGKDPDDFEFNYLKEADYCSGASIMVRKDIFVKLGGFDQAYAPAYFEDTDLAFGVRKLGYKVLYQPKSEIIHFEGKTAGTDVSKGFKAYQLVNRAKFYEKWKKVLEAEHFKPGENVFAARDRSRGRKTLLYIDHYVPTYDKDAGSLSTYMYLKLLSEMGLKVVFVPDNMMRVEPYTTALQQIGIEVVYGVDLNALIAEKGKYLDYVILSRPSASKYLERVKKHSKAKVIYNMHDLHYQRELKRFELENNKLILKEAEKLKEQEHHLFRDVDAVLTFSDKEAEYVTVNFPGKKAFIIPLFFYEGLKYTDPVELLKNKRDSIVFLGGFNHLPNVDAAEYFINDIFPIIRQRIPEVRLYIIGSNPPETIQKYSSQNVIITGFVKDLSVYFNKARVFVAPLRYGAGVKGKIITSMTFGVPTVITSVGNEGLNMENGVHCKVADEPEKFAAKVIEIYNDDRLWVKLSENSFNFLKENFSRETAESKIKEALGLSGREF